MQLFTKFHSLATFPQASEEINGLGPAQALADVTPFTAVAENALGKGMDIQISLLILGATSSLKTHNVILNICNSKLYCD